MIHALPGPRTRLVTSTRRSDYGDLKLGRYEINNGAIGLGGAARMQCSRGHLFTVTR